MSVLKKFDYLKIPLEDILLATNTFSKDHLVGKGGFGKVYKGELVHPKGHTTVAVKRLDRKFGQGDSEFWKEVIMLSVYKHENIVSLLGFCDEKGEKILVYEYASKQSLDLHLNSKDLTWVRRLTICIGAARGLAYLHDPAGTQQRVLHRDIKSSNILLDDNWNARIADLGLSKFGPANQLYTFVVSNNIAGTIGYCDPQYFMSGILTKESDVYSFGVVLFEVLCGRLCLGSNDKVESFVQSVRKHCKENMVEAIVCGNTKDEIHPTSLKVFSTLAYQCLKIDSGKRPLMNNIVTELETALVYQRELSAIFRKIGDKQTCGIGLYELYRITQLYPKIDIFSQLQNASEAFQTYIRDGLAQMEKIAATRRTPSSVPVPTPPQVDDQRNDRFQPGVSTSVLDAIRERMNSIQLNGSKFDHQSSHPTDEVSSTDNPHVPVHSGVLPMDEKTLSGLQARMERLKRQSMDPL